ncbi:MAG: hypothetical protein ABRQ39_05825 [Candidatus Eremiobacterota bacterium]
MGLFFKMNRAIKSEFNQMLRKTEEPEETLDELIEDLEKQQKELKDKLAKRSSEKDKLEEQLKQIEEKLEGARHRKDFYVARKKRMEAQKNILSAMSDIDDVSRYDRIIKGDKGL